MIKNLLISALLLPSLLIAADKIAPQKELEYAPLAFYPERWKANNIPTQLYPWFGKKIVFLTNTTDLDHKVMGEFITHLDSAWALYRNFTHKSPHPTRAIGKHSPIAALPTNTDLTCGQGCGYVGHQGIEINGFYTDSYPRLQKNTKDVPHIYFYEMGRNYYTFGKKHDTFTTGFAVFMRYVCIEKLALVDETYEIKEISSAIDIYEKSDIPFLKTFTNAYGLSEKESRLDKNTSDQPVMYASAMLKLWHHLGDDWLSGFYQHLDTAPEFDSSTEHGARQQALAWYVSASLAAKKDLKAVFVKRWRFEVSQKESRILSKIDWKRSKASVAEVLLSLNS